MSDELRVLIVDDEAPARDRLRRQLEDMPGVRVCGEAVNGHDALAALAATRPQVLLLDIRMPGMDGLETARHLARLDTPPAVIFTTAYGDHALEAFEADALAYLLKPVRQEKLAHALERAAALSLSQLDGLAGAAGRRSHISAVVGGNIRLVPVAEVRCFLAEQKYVTVVWPEGELPIEESLKALEEEFGEALLRVHRNALVAMRYVHGLARDGQGNWTVTVEGMATGVPVSRRMLTQVRKRLRGGP